MPRIKYVGPHDSVDVAGQAVAHGDTVDLPAGPAKSLLEQSDNWKPVKPHPPKASSTPNLNQNGA